MYCVLCIQCILYATTRRMYYITIVHIQHCIHTTTRHIAILLYGDITTVSLVCTTFQSGLAILSIITLTLTYIFVLFYILFFYLSPLLLLTCSLTHSHLHTTLTHNPTHNLTHSLTHSHPLTHSLRLPLTQPTATSHLSSLPLCPARGSGRRHWD